MDTQDIVITCRREKQWNYSEYYEGINAPHGTNH